MLFITNGLIIKMLFLSDSKAETPSYAGYFLSAVHLSSDNEPFSVLCVHSSSVFSLESCLRIFNLTVLTLNIQKK